MADRRAAPSLHHNAGEVTWPTQPFPLKPPPFARQSFTSKDLSPFLDSEERRRITKHARRSAESGPFTPPSVTDTVEMPGNNGGANFQGAAVDPAHGKLFVVSKDLPAMLKLELNSQDDAANGSLSKALSPEERGRKVYQWRSANCVTGTSWQGSLRLCRILINVSSRLGADEVRAIVTRGRGQMPAISNLVGCGFGFPDGVCVASRARAGICS